MARTAYPSDLTDTQWRLIEKRIPPAQPDGRYRHIKLVERTIGSKQGTGGSPGIAFLKKSLFQPVFADLWAIRHQL